MNWNLLFTVAITLCIIGLAVGAVPSQMNYQGKLTDPDGVALHGSYNLTFRIYTAVTGGTMLWNEAHPGVSVDHGLFDVVLGTTNPIELDFDAQYWIEIQVGAEILTPRQPLTTSPYAFRAIWADSAGAAASGFQQLRVQGETWITDSVEFIEGTNITLTQGANSITIDATGGTDSDWQVSGIDMYSIPVGNVGVGDVTPDHRFDVAGNIGLTGGCYINFGDTDGSAGYGFRDNGGTLQFKNDLGSWTDFGSGSDGDWEISGANVYTGIAPAPAGNVGIGIAAPEEKLHCTGNVLLSNDKYFEVEASTGSNIRIAGINGANLVQLGGLDAAVDAAIYAASSEVIRVRSTGDVGIGTTIPTYKLEVNGTGYIDGNFYLGTVPDDPLHDSVLTINGGQVMKIAATDIGGAGEWTDGGNYLYPTDLGDGGPDYYRVYEEGSAAAGLYIENNSGATVEVPVRGFKNLNTFGAPYGGHGAGVAGVGNRCGVYAEANGGGTATSAAIDAYNIPGGNYDAIGVRGRCLPATDYGFGVKAEGGNCGVYGISTGRTSGASGGTDVRAGVYGENNLDITAGAGPFATYGVYGVANGSATIAGEVRHYGVNGEAGNANTFNVGVRGYSPDGRGVQGENGAGPWGYIGSGLNGVFGYSDTLSGNAVFGYHGDAVGTGIYAVGNGLGTYYSMAVGAGLESNGADFGICSWADTDSSGIVGTSFTNFGIAGIYGSARRYDFADHTDAYRYSIYGSFPDQSNYSNYSGCVAGVVGLTNPMVGALGYSDDGGYFIAVNGIMGDGDYAGYFDGFTFGIIDSDSLTAIQGVNDNTIGDAIAAFGGGCNDAIHSGNGDGVIAVTDGTGWAVIGSHYDGVNNDRYGILGRDNSGVYGRSDNTTGAGVFGYSDATDGVYGQSDDGGSNGVWGINTDDGGRGVYGRESYTGAGSFSSFGIYGSVANSGNLDIGVYGTCDDIVADYAGYFSGDIYVTGDVGAGTKSFLIDHPDDPLNKTLRHRCVESPENLCLYRGKVELDGDGSATVEMPDYFVSLTKEDEATVNLTPVGKPFMFGYEWNKDFTAFTVFGEPDREIAYIVLADRDDPVIRSLARPVVAEKGTPESNIPKGLMLNPTAYGYPEEMNVIRLRPRDDTPKETNTPVERFSKPDRSRAGKTELSVQQDHTPVRVEKLPQADRTD